MKKFNYTSTNDFIGMDYDSYLITLNKDTANEMLSVSIGNRILRQDNIDALLRDINNGEYFYDTPGSGIAFNKAGKLVNGHHQLTAFLRSKVDYLTMTLFTGSNHLDKCDTGKSRTLKDSSVMTGNSNCSKVIKLAYSILRVLNGYALTNSGARKDISYSKIFDFANKNLDKLNELYDNICDYKQKNKNNLIAKYTKSEPAVIGTIMWELMYTENFPIDMVYKFAYGVISIDSNSNIDIDNFRKKVDKDSRKQIREGAWSYEEFRLNFKKYFYKYHKNEVKKLSVKAV